VIDLATARAHCMDAVAPVGNLIAVNGLAVEKAAEIAGNTAREARSISEFRRDCFLGRKSSGTSGLIESEHHSGSSSVQHLLNICL
jgi:hypothetical protein